jgi:N-acetylglucosamine kinase-like BadF-type ATPase
LLGDDGSGYAIGSAAVRALLRALDGRQPLEPLFDALLEQLGCKDAADVIARAYDPGGTAAIAACAATVIARADAGERTATKIVQSAALELADLVKALLRKTDCASRELPLAFSGGLLASNSMLTFLLETRLSHDAPHLHIVKRAPEPYFGALARARELVES